MHVDYAVDVPGLLGHMEVSLRLRVVAGMSCGGVAARLRHAVQSGQLNSMLADLGAAGLAVSLLNMSGCPGAMMPAAAAAAAAGEDQSVSAPRMLGPPGDGGRGGGAGGGVGRGRSGLTSEEAVEAAEQVATQTAQQVASEVATAAARDTANKLEGELRKLAAKVRFLLVISHVRLFIGRIGASFILFFFSHPLFFPSCLRAAQSARSNGQV